jgi:hypothetical protein
VGWGQLVDAITTELSEGNLKADTPKACDVSLRSKTNGDPVVLMCLFCGEVLGDHFLINNETKTATDIREDEKHPHPHFRDGLGRDMNDAAFGHPKKQTKKKKKKKKKPKRSKAQQSKDRQSRLHLEAIAKARMKCAMVGPAAIAAKGADVKWGFLTIDRFKREAQLRDDMKLCGLDDAKQSFVFEGADGEKFENGNDNATTRTFAHSGIQYIVVNEGQEASNSVLGCAVSHILLYRFMLSEFPLQQYFVVCEDDVFLPALVYFPAPLLKLITNAPPGWGCISLYQTMKHAPNHPQFQKWIDKIMSENFSTIALLFSRSGLEEVVNKLVTTPPTGRGEVVTITFPKSLQGTHEGDPYVAYSPLWDGLLPLVCNAYIQNQYALTVNTGNIHGDLKTTMAAGNEELTVQVSLR